MDVEASLEHFAQNKALHADTLLVVVEPYFRSLETGRRMVGLGKQLAPERLVLVANKVRDERELDAVEQLADSEGVAVAGAVPYDERLVDARAGRQCAARLRSPRTRGHGHRRARARAARDRGGR